MPHTRSIRPRTERGTTYERAYSLARSRPGAQGKATFPLDSAGLYWIPQDRTYDQKSNHGPRGS